MFICSPKPKKNVKNMEKQKSYGHLKIVKRGWFFPQKKEVQKASKKFSFFGVRNILNKPAFLPDIMHSYTSSKSVD